MKWFAKAFDPCNPPLLMIHAQTFIKGEPSWMFCTLEILALIAAATNWLSKTPGTLRKPAISYSEKPGLAYEARGTRLPSHATAPSSRGKSPF